MSAIKVSVVVPCYNSERFISECLDSILDQTLKEIEIICVDDGSTDDTLVILNDYNKKDPRIKVLTQKNQYAGVARNKGMDAASGKYLSFLDSDDFFDSFMLEKMYKLCEQDDAEICITGALDYNIAFRKVNIHARPNHSFLPKTIPFSPFDLPDRIFHIINPAPWTKLFRSDFIRTHKLRFQAIQYTNDIYFGFMAIALAARITVLDRLCVYYRRGTSTSLQETRDSAPLCFYDAIKALKEGLMKYGLFEMFEKSFTFRCLNLGVNPLNFAKSKEQWIRVALFLKEQYFHEFGLWDRREQPGLTKKSVEIMTFLMNSTPAALARYEPALRLDETTIQTSDFEDIGLKNHLDSSTAKISVIIYTNSENEYFDECKDSLTWQTLKGIEVICVHNNASEKEEQVINQADQTVKHIYFVQDICAAISAAKGEYVLFMNGADLLIRNALEHLYRQARYHDLDILFCKALVFYEPANLYHQYPDALNRWSKIGGKYPSPVSGPKLMTNMVVSRDFDMFSGPNLIRRTILASENKHFAKKHTFSMEALAVHLLGTATCLAWIHDEPLYLKRIYYDAKAYQVDSCASACNNYLVLLEVERQITLHESKVASSVLKILKARYERLLGECGAANTSQMWNDFANEKTIYSVQFIKEVQKAVQMQLKKEKKMSGKTICFLRRRKVLFNPFRYMKKKFRSIRNRLKSIILKSKLLTFVAYKVYRLIRGL